MNEHQITVRRTRGLLTLLGTFVLVLGGGTLPSMAQDGGAAIAPGWGQWGGAHGDFHVDSSELADEWPAGGPAVLWSRSLGDGYSSILQAGERLFTMYRSGGDEIVVALDQRTGGTLWEFHYSAPPGAGQSAQYGFGPQATPLLVGNRLITMGFTGRMYCLSADKGKMLWKHDFIDEMGGVPQFYGHAASPIACGGRIIALVGGEGHGVVALNPADGSIAWTSE